MDLADMLDFVDFFKGKGMWFWDENLSSELMGNFIKNYYLFDLNTLFRLQKLLSYNYMLVHAGSTNKLVSEFNTLFEDTIMIRQK